MEWRAAKGNGGASVLAWVWRTAD